MVQAPATVPRMDNVPPKAGQSARGKKTAPQVKSREKISSFEGMLSRKQKRALYAQGPKRIGYPYQAAMITITPSSAPPSLKEKVTRIT